MERTVHNEHSAKEVTVQGHGALSAELKLLHFGVPEPQIPLSNSPPGNRLSR